MKEKTCNSINDWQVNEPLIKSIFSLIVEHDFIFKLNWLLVVEFALAHRLNLFLLWSKFIGCSIYILNFIFFRFITFFTFNDKWELLWFEMNSNPSCIYIYFKSLLFMKHHDMWLRLQHNSRIKCTDVMWEGHLIVVLKCFCLNANLYTTLTINLLSIQKIK